MTAPISGISLVMVVVVVVLILQAGCSQLSRQTNPMDDQEKQSEKTIPPEDTTPKVTGVGGIFFFSDDPERLKKWYAENLGLEVNQWGSTFEFRNAHKPEEVNYLQWSPFEKGSAYFAPSQKEFMINYRVKNIEALVKKLKGKGVTIVDSIVTYEYGKFVHILDEEGNKIELWEPIDSALTALGEKTTK